MLEGCRSTGYEGVGIVLRVGNWSTPAWGNCSKEYVYNTEQHVDRGIKMKFWGASFDSERDERTKDSSLLNIKYYSNTAQPFEQSSTYAECLNVIGGIFGLGFPRIYVERLCETPGMQDDSGEDTNVRIAQHDPPIGPKGVEKRVAFSIPGRNKIDFGVASRNGEG
jgi:hypothetical protein